jgi:lipopolysaccharide transport system ATP-binding protein
VSAPIISVENLGKKYQLNHLGQRRSYTALRDVVADKARRILRSPFARRSESVESRSRTEEFWALQDVSFEVQPGEVLGIIGRNGAGKSTLLKILSRITEPTTGSVSIRGRVASLLEVGTGFHPELTGRDNIFLNGAILGMKRAEIQRKFDEIVAFAEVEKFLDTPVKHYSSGMYVRLAFAVAAHLEPEILVVDEVLAVGDAEFQKKCLGKMQDVSKGGRTVLFVSHNMAAVKSLTNRGILLKQGHLLFDGPTEEAVQSYVQHSAVSGKDAPNRSWGRGVHTAIRAVRLLDACGRPANTYTPGKPMYIEVTFDTDGTGNLSLEIFLADSARCRIGMASLYQFHGEVLPSARGTYSCVLSIEALWLASGSYFLDVSTSVINVEWDHRVEAALEFDVPFSNPLGREFDFRQALGFGSLALLSDSRIRFNKIAEVSGVEKRTGLFIPKNHQLFSEGLVECGD